MVEQLWAPWRLSYVAGDKPEGCPLCDKQHDDTSESLVIAGGELTYVVMNLYPYNNGHVMIVPRRHVADPTDLSGDEAQEMHAMLLRTLTALRSALSPEGFNVGMNLGAAAGAGIEPHLHTHVVPRWAGDTNFMPVLADTKVMPQHLHQTRDQLRQALVQQIQETSENA